MLPFVRDGSLVRRRRRRRRQKNTHHRELENENKILPPPPAPSCVEPCAEIDDSSIPFNNAQYLEEKSCLLNENKKINTEVVNESFEDNLKHLDEKKQKLFLENVFEKCYKAANYNLDTCKAMMLQLQIKTEVFLNKNDESLHIETYAPVEISSTKNLPIENPPIENLPIEIPKETVISPTKNLDESTIDKKIKELFGEEFFESDEKFMENQLVNNSSILFTPTGYNEPGNTSHERLKTPMLCSKNNTQISLNDCEKQNISISKKKMSSLTKNKNLTRSCPTNVKLDEKCLDEKPMCHTVNTTSLHHSLNSHNEVSPRIKPIVIKASHSNGYYLSSATDKENSNKNVYIEQRGRPSSGRFSRVISVKNTKIIETSENCDVKESSVCCDKTISKADFINEDIQSLINPKHSTRKCQKPLSEILPKTLEISNEESLANTLEESSVASKIVETDCESKKTLNNLPEYLNESFVNHEKIVSKTICETIEDFKILSANQTTGNFHSISEKSILVEDQKNNLIESLTNQKEFSLNSDEKVSETNRSVNKLVDDSVLKENYNIQSTTNCKQTVSKTENLTKEVLNELSANQATEKIHSTFEKSILEEDKMIKDNLKESLTNQKEFPISPEEEVSETTSSVIKLVDQSVLNEDCNIQSSTSCEQTASKTENLTKEVLNELSANQATEKIHSTSEKSILEVDKMIKDNLKESLTNQKEFPISHEEEVSEANRSVNKLIDDSVLKENYNIQSTTSCKQTASKTENLTKEVLNELSTNQATEKIHSTSEKSILEEDKIIKDNLKESFTNQKEFPMSPEEEVSETTSSVIKLVDQSVLNEDCNIQSSTSCEQTASETENLTIEVLKKVSKVIDKNNDIYKHSIINELAIYFLNHDFVYKVDELWHTVESQLIGELIINLIDMFNKTDHNFAYLSGCLMSIFRKIVDNPLISQKEIYIKFNAFIDSIKKYVIFYDLEFFKNWFRHPTFIDWCCVVDYIIACEGPTIKFIIEEPQASNAMSYFLKVTTEQYMFTLSTTNIITGIFEPTNINDHLDVEDSLASLLEFSQSIIGSDTDEPRPKKKKIDEHCAAVQSLIECENINVVVSPDHNSMEQINNDEFVDIQNANKTIEITSQSKSECMSKCTNEPNTKKRKLDNHCTEAQNSMGSKNVDVESSSNLHNCTTSLHSQVGSSKQINSNELVDIENANKTIEITSQNISECMSKCTNEPNTKKQKLDNHCTEAQNSMGSENVDVKSSSNLHNCTTSLHSQVGSSKQINSNELVDIENANKTIEITSQNISDCMSKCTNEPNTKKRKLDNHCTEAQNSMGSENVGVESSSNLHNCTTSLHSQVGLSKQINSNELLDVEKSDLSSGDIIPQNSLNNAIASSNTNESSSINITLDGHCTETPNSIANKNVNEKIILSKPSISVRKDLFEGICTFAVIEQPTDASPFNSVNQTNNQELNSVASSNVQCQTQNPFFTIGSNPQKFSLSYNSSVNHNMSPYYTHISPNMNSLQQLNQIVSNRLNITYNNVINNYNSFSPNTSNSNQMPQPNNSNDIAMNSINHSTSSGRSKNRHISKAELTYAYSQLCCSVSNPTPSYSTYPNTTVNSTNYNITTNLPGSVNLSRSVSVNGSSTNSSLSNAFPSSCSKSTTTSASRTSSIQNLNPSASVGSSNSFTVNDTLPNSSSLNAFPSNGYIPSRYPYGGYPSIGYQSSGYPYSGFPSSGYPSSGYPSNSFPPNCFPSCCFPSSSSKSTTASSSETLSIQKTNPSSSVRSSYSSTVIRSQLNSSLLNATLSSSSKSTTVSSSGSSSVQSTNSYPVNYLNNRISSINPQPSVAATVVNSQSPSYISQVSPDLPDARLPNMPNLPNDNNKCKANNCNNTQEFRCVCLKARYCSAACQAHDWQFHAKDCSRK